MSVTSSSIAVMGSSKPATIMLEVVLPTSKTLPNAPRDVWQSAGFYQHVIAKGPLGTEKSTADKISRIVLDYYDVRERQIIEGLHEKDFDALVDGFNAEACRNSSSFKKNNLLARAILTCRNATGAYALVEQVVQNQFHYLLPALGGSAQAYFDLPFVDYRAFISGSDRIARGAIMKANMEINRDACWIENLCYNDTIPQRLWVALKRDAGADNPWWRSPLAGDLFIREFSSWPKVAWTQTLFGLRPSMSEECIFPTISYQTPSGGPPDYMPCLQGFGPGIPKDQTFEKWSKFIQNTVLDPSKSTAKSATASSHSEPVKPPTASTATAAQGTAP